MLKKILMDIGFASDKISEAENGEDALDKITETHQKGSDFDFIFLDLNMPIMGGIDLLKALDKNTNLNISSKIIIVSAESEKSTVLEALSLGASSYVNKPPKQEEVADNVSD